MQRRLGSQDGWQWDTQMQMWLEKLRQYGSLWEP